MGKGFDQPWLAIFSDGFRLLATMRLSNETLMVMFVMFSKVTYNNFIIFKQSDIAKVLGIKPQQVSRAIKQLVGLEIVFLQHRHSKHSVYLLNPDIGFKGKWDKIGMVRGMVNDIRNKELKNGQHKTTGDNAS